MVSHHDLQSLPDTLNSGKTWSVNGFRMTPWRFSMSLANIIWLTSLQKKCEMVLTSATFKVPSCYAFQTLSILLSWQFITTANVWQNNWFLLLLEWSSWRTLFPNFLLWLLPHAAARSWQSHTCPVPVDNWFGASTVLLCPHVSYSAGLFWLSEFAILPTFLESTQVVSVVLFLDTQMGGV